MNNQISINASLPVIVKVLEKSSFNRYKLSFGNTILRTKSYLSLDIGEEYFANIRSQSGGVININGLFKRENGKYHEDGFEFLQNFIENPDIKALLNLIKLKLKTSNNENEFKLYFSMLLALQENIINIAFLYNNRYCLAQIRLKNVLEVYFLYDNFPPIKFNINNGKIIALSTPFESFSRALGEILSCEFNTLKFGPLRKEGEKFVDNKF